MTNIEQKALAHVLRTIESIDTFPIHSALSKAMVEAQITNDIKTMILDKYETAMAAQILKIRDAQEWLKAIITDSQKKN